MIPDTLTLERYGSVQMPTQPSVRPAIEKVAVAAPAPTETTRTVAAVMHAPAVTIQQDASVGAALCLMRRHGVHRLPVVDADGRLQGILTYGDIRRLKTLRMLQFNPHIIAEALIEMAVSEVMTRRPQTVMSTTSLLDAGRLMVDSRISGLPVVDTAGMVVGIVTERDLFEALLSLAPAPMCKS